MLAFSGFPIGMVLDLHPATHRGMAAANRAVALPSVTARQLKERDRTSEREYLCE
jgi:hypothetical protein